MDLDAKIDVAKNLITEELARSAKPIIMSSFGKDSMVMLELFKMVGRKLPILFIKEPFYPLKYWFSNKVIEDNDYVVYDYPPLSTGIARHEGKTEIAMFYQVGTEEDYMFLPVGVRDPAPGEPFLCGLFDLYDRPCGTFNFPWDTVFIGHKSSDHDPILGDVPLVGNTVDSVIRAVFPIEAFTDEDIWTFTERFNVPINAKRYDKKNGWKEFLDLTYNPDCFPACIRCMDRDQPEVVLCPKTNTEILNVSASLRYVQVQLPGYVRK